MSCSLDLGGGCLHDVMIEPRIPRFYQEERRNERREQRRMTLADKENRVGLMVRKTGAVDLSFFWHRWCESSLNISMSRSCQRGRAASERECWNLGGPVGRHHISVMEELGPRIIKLPILEGIKPCKCMAIFRDFTHHSIIPDLVKVVQ